MSLNELSKQQRFAVSGVIFLAVVTALLIGLSIAANHLPPPSQPITPLSRMTGKQGRKLTYLERLFRDATRGLKEKAGGAQRLPSKVQKTVQSAAPRSVRMTVKDPERMRYRQSLIAHQILTRYQGVPVEKALKRVQRIPGKGAWRSYELTRLKVRILSERFDKNKNASVLPEYKRLAIRAADSQFSNFEDLLFAGHSCLYSKDVNKAEKYLTEAWSIWPAKDDWSGFCYTFLTCIAGIRNNTEATLDRIDGFQQNFPDWLYSEIYLPEFDFLEKTYPDAPLIKVFHGRVLHLVADDASALKKFTEALRHPRLDRDARKQVAEWIKEIRDNRAKKEG